MGAYLSEPVTTKESAEGGNERLKYGVSAMQGWRTGMEDAHSVRAVAAARAPPARSQPATLQPRPF